MKNITKVKKPFIINQSNIKFLHVIIVLFAFSLVIGQSLDSLLFSLVWAILIALAIKQDITNEIYLISIKKAKRVKGVK